MDVMLPHETMKVGRGEPKSRVIVWMSQHHDNAIGGVVTGSEPSFHKLGANTSTLIGWKDCHRCQPSCLHSGSPRPSNHPSVLCACPHCLWAEGGHALRHTPLSAAAVLPPASAAPAGGSPAHGD